VSGGTDLEDLRSTITGKKHLSKAVWAFSLAAIAGFVKFSWDILSNLF